jgi:predicted HAD superfamily phosphohydrolase YqeG
LIAHGADKTITDNNGHTVTNHAEKRLQPELAEWFTAINPKNVLPVVIPSNNNNSPLILTLSVQAFRDARQTKPKVTALTRHR